MSPAIQVLPTVRLLLPCREVYTATEDGALMLRDPWSAVLLPEGASFPFRVDEVWLYAQLTGGRGTVELGVEFLQVMDDGAFGEGTRRSIRSGRLRPVDCTADHPLVPVQNSFPVGKVPFRTEGRYEFRVIAATPDGLRALNGQTATFNVIDTRRRA